MTDTIVTHRACSTPIFIVRGGIHDGDPIEAHRFEPLNAEWPQPRPGDRIVCPNCGKGFLMDDADLERTDVAQG